MPFEEHQRIPPVDPPEMRLWRYMDFAKFVSLLDKSALFFARADQLGDPFEGSFPPSAIPYRHEWLKAAQMSSQEWPARLEKWQRDNQKKRETVWISCWHANDVESAALWAMYSERSAAIAVRTTVERLKEALSAAVHHVFLGRVKYIDYTAESFVSDMNILHRYLHKRRSFEFEQEVRAICFYSKNDRRALVRKSPDDPWPLGIYVDVDLPKLVESVVIAPDAPDWILELTKSVSEKYGLEVQVNRSGLEAEPLY